MSTSKADLVHAISFGRRILWAFGLFHCKHFPKHSAHNYMTVIMIAFSLPVPILIGLHILQSGSGFNEYLETGVFVAGSLWITIQMFVQILYLPYVAELEDMLEANYEYFNPQTELHAQFIAAKNTRLKTISYIVVSCMYCFTLLLMVSPLLNTNSLLIPMWMPFENEVLGTYIYESFYLMVYSYVYPVFYNTFLGPILMVTGQFRILKDNLLHSTDRDESEDPITQEKRIQERLKKCVIHHNAILRFVKKVENVFEPVFLIHILWTVIQVCFTILQIQTDNNDHFVLLISYLGILIFQIYLICWVGNDLITESSDITDACYMSDWYTCSISTQRMFIIIMSNTQEPIVLQSVIFPVSFVTFVTILRTSYSYYTVFRQMYD